MPIATYNMRSKPEIGRISIENILSFDGTTGEFFIDFDEVVKRSENISNIPMLKERGIIVDVSNCTIVEDKQDGSKQFNLDFTAVAPNLLTTITANPVDPPWWLNLTAKNQTNLSIAMRWLW